MRLFVALELPEGWKDLLAQVEHDIGWLGRGIRWVDMRGTHLTLKFLGEVGEETLPHVDRALGVACSESAAFHLRLRGTGVFPNSKRPRVFWAGVEAPPELLRLQARIEKDMHALGFDKEDHEFRPHLTLARIKDPFGKERITAALLSYRLESAPALFREVQLMRSHLSPAGARYETLRRYPLAAT